MPQNRKNRFEVFTTKHTKKELDDFQLEFGFNQRDAISTLILSITEVDLMPKPASAKTLIDSQLTDEAQAHLENLQLAFGSKASKKKLLELALSKIE
ncbi:hypothetical protein WE348_21440 (plasmid) [Alteromonas macleodii]|uniref:hypothetical protein n=1 Tax=Alteromonas macleodii TaxID=28108 RepID=UPI0030D43EC0